MMKPGFGLKFERASFHFAELQSVAAQYLQRMPYTITRDEESDPFKVLFWITLLEEPPAEIALAAGDAIHNLRSALDHIIYEISAKFEVNPARTGFPLLMDEAEWEKRGNNGRLHRGCGLDRVRWLPPEAIRMIRNMQPWPRSEPFMPDLWGPNRQSLRELHDLDINDKHKNLNLAVFHAEMVAIGTEEPSNIGFEYVHEGPLQHGARTLLARLSHASGVDVKPMPKLEIIFREGLMPSEPVTSKLEDFLRNVGNVLDRLSRFA
jgi:hypothetical protein